MKHLYVTCGLVFTTICSILAAPSLNRNTASQLKEQMKNLNNEFSMLSSQFRSVFNNVNNGKKQFGGLNDKREISSEDQEKKDKKEMYEKLKEMAKQLKVLHKNMEKLREKVHSMKESLDYDNDDDDGDDDFDLDRRGLKSLKQDPDSPECIKKSIVEENDPLILKIALAITKQISANDNRAFIEELVNTTADDIVVKMKASHGVKNFHKRLLKTVLQLLKVRSILTIKTEGEFIDQLDSRTLKGKQLETEKSQSKIIKALEELLKDPLAKGFVSKEEEKKMITEAVKTLSVAFGFSDTKTKAVIKVIVNHIEKDVKEKVAKHGKEKSKELSDEEKVKGLGKMVFDKAMEKELNKDELTLLVKGLASAVATRNKLSEKRKKEIENKILKTANDMFGKMNKSEVAKEKSSGEYVKHMLEKYKDIPSGFKEAYVKKYGGDKTRFDEGKDTLSVLKEAAKKQKKADDLDEKETRTILEKLKELEEMATKIGGPALPKTLPSSKEDLGDKGDQVVIDAATNTRGSTRIVEHHNGKRDVTEASKTDTSDQLSGDVQHLVDSLEESILLFKNKISKYNKSPMSGNKNKTHEKVVIDVAKGTMGARKLEEGYKRKRQLAESIRKFIKLVKTFIPEQSRKPVEIATTTLPPPEGPTTRVPATEKPVTEKNSQESKEKSDEKQPADENLSGKASEGEEKSKKSEISDTMMAEIEKAEAEIQKELEIQQRKEQDKMLLAAEKEQEEKEKKLKQEQKGRKREKLEENEGKEQKEEARKEKEEQEKEQGKEKQEQEEEQAKEKEENRKEDLEQKEEHEKEKAEHEKEHEKEKDEHEKEHEKEKDEHEKEHEKEKDEHEKEHEKEKDEHEKEHEKEKGEHEKEHEKEKEQGKEKEEKDKESVAAKSKVVDQNEAKIKHDVKEIEKELDIKREEKTNLLDKLQSLEKGEENEKQKNEDDNDLIKQLDQLFAKS